ncbi:MAG: hypothetical protein IT334_12550 [Thermomicrobiales bacterium]|nr:hypothetical protein [Thermomicrobiales bacterium]
MARLFLLIIFAYALVLATPASAQDSSTPTRDGQFAGSINDPLIVQEHERLHMVIGIHNDTLVNGTVENLLVVIDGTATINGEVTQEILAFSSHIVIGPNGRANNITLQNSTLEIMPGGVVLGQTEMVGSFFLLEWWSSPTFALVIWVLTTLFLLAGGVIFTLAAGQQFPIFVSGASRRIGRNLLTALTVWIAIPILALLVMFTIIGIPLGLVMIGLVLPGLWWLGYTLIGARVGTLLLRPFTREYSTGAAVLATIIGILLLQLTILLPYVGGMVIFVSGAYGAGALVYHLLKGRHDRPIDPELAAFGPEFSRASADLRHRD